MMRCEISQRGNQQLRIALLMLCSVATASIGSAQRIDLKDDFYRMVFQNSQHPDQARILFRSNIASRLDQWDLTVHLTDSQRRKMQLAGTGDIERFMNRLAKGIGEYENLQKDDGDPNTLWQLAQPLRNELESGLFDDESLFHRTFIQNLDGSQRTKWQEELNRKNKKRSQSIIKLQLALLAREAAMTPTQRSRLEKEFGESLPLVKLDERQSLYYFEYLSSEIPQSTVDEILDKKQAAMFQSVRARGRQRKPHLIREGILDE